MTNNWSEITSIDQISNIVADSHESPQLIYKHSTRCNLSSTIYDHLRNWDLKKKVVAIHYLDLIAYRQVSDYIEKQFGILHESPQVIILHNGKPVYDEDHYRIKGEKIEEVLATVAV